MEKELPWSSHERVMYHPVSHDMSSREREEKSGEARRHIDTRGTCGGLSYCSKKEIFNNAAYQIARREQAAQTVGEV